MTGAERIAVERQRQIEQEGWTPEHDDQHCDGELAVVAAGLTLSPWWRKEPMPVRWGQVLAEKHSGNRMRQLIIAGALIAAEIDRLLRLAEPADAR